VAPLRDIVDAACRDVGRDPAEIERTVAVHVRLPGGTGRTMGETSTTDQIRPLDGDPETMAAELRAYAAAGIAEVQLVLDPIDRLAIERFAGVLPILDRD
jgi:alkanesulfonate monooxygenase SsuD/methylene tetrahydromethanopterin reductase-like flavin-dependent oxidoreductase (luciferase family)